MLIAPSVETVASRDLQLRDLAVSSCSMRSLRQVWSLLGRLMPTTAWCTAHQHRNETCFSHPACSEAPTSFNRPNPCINPVLTCHSHRTSSHKREAVPPAGRAQLCWQIRTAAWSSIWAVARGKRLRSQECPMACLHSNKS